MDAAAHKSLLLQMLEMNESDLSILRAALQQTRTHAAGGFGKKGQEVNFYTLKGSANDLLWGKFADLGWLSQIDIPQLTRDQPEGIPPGKAYLLTDGGRAPIAALLAERDARHAKPKSEKEATISALGRFHDQRSEPFVLELIAAAKAAGGTGPDIAALGSLLVKSIVQAIAIPGHEEQAIEDISRMALATVKRESQASSTS